MELFKDLPVKRTKASKEYGEFTDKFKIKKTTDDCYTPDAVYNAVRRWTIQEYHIEGREIVRPFWPGGDFETFDYPRNCVVIDNPPFSLYDKILKFYTEKNIDFMLFGPSLTLFKKYDCCYIVTNETVTYANGAKVTTSFVTSLDKEYRVRTCRTLKDAINEAEHVQKVKKADLPIIVYPECFVTSAILGKTSRVDFSIRKKDAAFCTHLNGERIFGSGFLLSDRAAADRAAERKKVVRTLGEEEKETIKRLNTNTQGYKNDTKRP
jgi:hypothetical protein